MEKINIEESYYYFLSKDSDGWSKADEKTIKQKTQDLEILKELIDVSNETVQCLTKEETEMVRKYIGVYEKKYTITEISKSFNISTSYASAKIKHIAKTLRTRIKRGCAYLKDAYINGEITEEELLNTRLFDSDYPHDIGILNTMSVNDCITIGDLIKNDIRTIRKFRNVGEKSLNDLVDYIHSIGLMFHDEKIDYKTNFFDVNVTLLELESAEKACDDIILEQINKKQKIIELRKNLLNRAKEAEMRRYKMVDRDNIDQIVFK